MYLSAASLFSSTVEPGWILVKIVHHLVIAGGDEKFIEN